MLKYSIHIELFIILWVIKLINKKSSVYTMLDKGTIENEILPSLFMAKCGYAIQSCFMEVVNAILYILKTSSPWVFLPIKVLFSGKVLIYAAVYHDYNKWSKADEWKFVWIKQLDNHCTKLDLFNVDLVGSHTIALCCNEEVGCQSSKKKITNFFYLMDMQGGHLPCLLRNRDNIMMCIISKKPQWHI